MYRASKQAKSNMSDIRPNPAMNDPAIGKYMEIRPLFSLLKLRRFRTTPVWPQALS